MRALLPFAVVLCSALSAQTSFAPLGATWTYLTTVWQPPWTGGYGQYTVSVTGDTVLIGETCSIIHFPPFTDCGFPDQATTQRDIDLVTSPICSHGYSVRATWR
jgi:hypothetical protein